MTVQSRKSAFYRCFTIYLAHVLCLCHRSHQEVYQLILTQIIDDFLIDTQDPDDKDEFMWMRLFDTYRYIGKDSKTYLHDHHALEELVESGIFHITLCHSVFSI